MCNHEQDPMETADATSSAVLDKELRSSRIPDRAGH